jgi:hypothetical protein
MDFLIQWTCQTNLTWSPPIDTILSSTPAFYLQIPPLACPAGSSALLSSTCNGYSFSCVPCPVGTFSVANSLRCTPCGPSQICPFASPLPYDIDTQLSWRHCLINTFPFNTSTPNRPAITDYWIASNVTVFYALIFLGTLVLLLILLLAFFCLEDQDLRARVCTDMTIIMIVIII